MFVPGLELSRAFYLQVVRPLTGTVPHSAALIGPGSEVLAFDTERSTDHDWGPRVLLFAHPADVGPLRARITAELPATFGGYPTSFGSDRNPVRPGVHVTDAASWLTARLGFDPCRPPTLLDWLATPWQNLAEVTSGEVFHDDLGELTTARENLRWYPGDLWRHVLACQWRRVAQRESFPGRCAEVGDELGATQQTALLAVDLTRLALLMRRRYPPYGKWLGSAFARLPGSAELGDHLAAALAAPGWPTAEDHLCQAYGLAAALHNRLGLTDPLDTAVRAYHKRPQRVLFAGRFADALHAGVTDTAVRALPAAGTVDQFADSVRLLGDHTARRAAVAAVLGPIGNVAA
jgi:hypothetical protein